MAVSLGEVNSARTVHPWLRKICISSVDEYRNPSLEQVIDILLQHFRRHGHDVQSEPDNRTDVILTSVPFGEAIDWREAMLFTARRRFNLDAAPVIFTLLQVTPDRFQTLLDHFRSALVKVPPDPADFEFPGLAPQAHKVLIEQGQRGGPILALERLVQAQAKSIRVLLVVGDRKPREAYLFDLVGAHPCISGDDEENFYDDIVLRMVTVASTREVTNHKVTGEPISHERWRQLTAPGAMRKASLELGKRNFFTPMVRIADLVKVPAVEKSVASQYSEGCFATWEPELNVLVATVTGSARPVDKGNINEDDLAVIVDVQFDGSGVVVRNVEGKRNDFPSSEAVEMMEMDRALSRITLGGEWGKSVNVPVVRSKLHGHRGVASYNPKHVEHVFLEPPYYHFPVSCATDAQARSIKATFFRSQALQDLEDPRQVIFTVLPGHGVVLVEKWVPGKAPFQVIWECIDAGFIEVDNRIPQGLLSYVLGPDGRMVLQTL